MLTPELLAVVDKYKHIRFGIPSTYPKTWKERCEVISSIMTFKGGQHYTWEQVWNSSPTGELFQVFQWWDDCVIWLEAWSRKLSGEPEDVIVSDMKKRTALR